MIKTTKFQLVLISTLTILVFSNIFQNDFVVDDHDFIVNWQETKSFTNLPHLLLSQSGPSGHPASFRPVKSLVLALGYQFWGLNPIGYHVLSLTVHLIATILIYFITKQIVLSKKKSIIHNTYSIIPFITALLFGVHPIHVEPITYMIASFDNLGNMFLLASFLYYLGSSKIKSLILASLAFLTYEFTFILPLLLILYELLFSDKRQVTRDKVIKILPYFGLIIGVVLIRTSLGIDFSRGHYMADSFYHTIISMPEIFLRYIFLLVWPVNLSYIHTIAPGFESYMSPYSNFQSILSKSILDPKVIVSIVCIVSLLIAGWKLRKKFPLISFSLFWFFICLLPVSYIIPVGPALSERYLYLASFGFILLLGYSVQFTAYRLKKHARMLLVTCYLLLVTFYSYQTYIYNSAWKNEGTVYTQVLKVYPESVIGRYHRAVYYHQTSREYEKAIADYKILLKNNPNMWESRVNLENISNLR